MRTNFSRCLSIAFGAIAGLFLIPGNLQALNLHAPAQCPDGKIVECAKLVCAAGGGKVLIAPGVYFETIITGNCNNLSLIGAGVDQTIIDGTNVVSPVIPPILIRMGNPLATLPVATIQQNFKVAHMTVRCQGTCPSDAIVAPLVDGVEFHDLKVTGFAAASLATLSSNFVSIKNVEIECKQDPGPVPLRVSNGIIFNAKPGAGVPNTPLLNPIYNQTEGHVVKNNTIRNCFYGIEAQNILDSVISKNLIVGGARGIKVEGGDNLLIRNNVVADVDSAFSSLTAASPASGMMFQSMNHSLVAHNTVCESQDAPAIRFDATNIPIHVNLWGSPPENVDYPDGNSSNLISKNELLGYGVADCGFGPATETSPLGWCFDTAQNVNFSLSDGGGNAFWKNQSDAEGQCPQDL